MRPKEYFQAMPVIPIGNRAADANEFSFPRHLRGRFASLGRPIPRCLEAWCRLKLGIEQQITNCTSLGSSLSTLWDCKLQFCRSSADGHDHQNHSLAFKI